MNADQVASVREQISLNFSSVASEMRNITLRRVILRRNPWYNDSLTFTRELPPKEVILSYEWVKNIKLRIVTVYRFDVKSFQNIYANRGKSNV